MRAELVQRLREGGRCGSPESPGRSRLRRWPKPTNTRGQGNGTNVTATGPGSRLWHVVLDRSRTKPPSARAETSGHVRSRSACFQPQRGMGDPDQDSPLILCVLAGARVAVGGQHHGGRPSTHRQPAGSSRTYSLPMISGDFEELLVVHSDWPGSTIAGEPGIVSGILTLSATVDGGAGLNLAVGGSGAAPEECATMSSSSSHPSRPTLSLTLSPTDRAAADCPGGRRSATQCRSARRSRRCSGNDRYPDSPASAASVDVRSRLHGFLNSCACPPSPLIFRCCFCRVWPERSRLVPSAATLVR